MGKVSSIDDRKILIYRHRRLDTGKIFYVGIAVIPTRPYDKKSRNKLWQNIVSKTDYSVEIIGIVDNQDLARELEELLIREYGDVAVLPGIYNPQDPSNFIVAAGNPNVDNIVNLALSQLS